MKKLIAVALVLISVFAVCAVAYAGEPQNKDNMELSSPIYASVMQTSDVCLEDVKIYKTVENGLLILGEICFKVHWEKMSETDDVLIMELDELQAVVHDYYQNTDGTLMISIQEAYELYETWKWVGEYFAGSAY